MWKCLMIGFLYFAIGCFAGMIMIDSHYHHLLEETEHLCKRKIAKEIFAEIEFDINNLDFDSEETRAIAIEGVIENAKKRHIGDT